MREITVLPSLAILLAISMILFVLVMLPMYYYNIRLLLYLRKNRPDLLEYTSGRYYLGLDNIKTAFQRSKEWHFGDLGEEDETVKKYKTSLKTLYKISYVLIALILVSFILIVLLNP